MASPPLAACATTGRFSSAKLPKVRGILYRKQQQQQQQQQRSSLSAIHVTFDTRPPAARRGARALKKAAK
jgi:hypothetical protein